MLTTIAFLGVSGPPPASAQVRPAVVKNVDEPGRIPYQQYVSGSLGGLNCGTNFCNFDLPAVPAGKRLVITKFAGNMALAGSATVARLTLSIFSGGPLLEVPNNSSAYHVDGLTAGGPNRYAFGMDTLLFAEAGQAVAISFYTTGSLATGVAQGFIVTGYLVDLTI
jgi:hypothetical protein